MWARCPVCERRLSRVEAGEAERFQAIVCTGCGSCIGLATDSTWLIRGLVGLAVAGPVALWLLHHGRWGWAMVAAVVIGHYADRLVRRFPIGRMKLVTMAPGRCAACGYDLTGLTSERCPECGAGILKRVGRGVSECGFNFFGGVKSSPVICPTIFGGEKLGARNRSES